MVFDERRFDHDVTEVLFNPEAIIEHFLDDRLIVRHTAGDEFQKIVVAATDQVALHDLVDFLGA